MPDDSTLTILLKQHFKEDDASFADIRAHLKKNEEIAIFNGEHMSHIRKDLSITTKGIDEVKAMLAAQNRDMEAHKARIEPMINSYERDKIADEVNRRRGSTFIKYVMSISGLIGAWWVIRDFIIKP